METSNAASVAQATAAAYLALVSTLQRHHGLDVEELLRRLDVSRHAAAQGPGAEVAVAILDSWIDRVKALKQDR